jgi:hypothetical protein
MQLSANLVGAETSKDQPMGFHVVNMVDGKISHEYAQTETDLAFLDISETSIMYEGEAHWTPEVVGSSAKYKNWAHSWYRAGIKAQELFKKQATENGYILEILNQDQQSFKSYTSTAKSVRIKRGDFLIRNVKNIEIDVKCRSFFTENGETMFNFKTDHYYCHKRMMEFTKTPIIIAVYARVREEPDPKRLYMFEINDIEKKALKQVNVKKVGPCLQIPLNMTVKGFGLIEEHKLSMD